MFFAARALERIGPWNVPEVIASPRAAASLVVDQAVSLAVDQAVSLAVDRVVDPEVSPMEGRAACLVANRVASPELEPEASPAVSKMVKRAVVPVASPEIATSEVRRSVRRVVRQRAMPDNAAIGAVVKVQVLAVAEPGHEAHPMSGRNARLVPSGLLSPRKSTSPNLIQPS